MKLEINNRTKSKIDLSMVKSVVAKFGRVYRIKKSSELSIAFVGGAEMKKLNRIYRGLDKTTDILSFSGDGSFLGELVMDYGRVKKQAGQFGNTAKQELVFILLHGLLHLSGYDDKTEKGRLMMIKLGEKFIKKYL